MSTWTTVRRKKGRRRGPFRDEEYCAHGHDHAHGHDAPPPERPAAWRADHEALVARLRAHPWMAAAVAAVSQKPYATVRAYGLGSAFSSRNARYQLAALVILAEALGAAAEAHDPVVDAAETAAWAELGVGAAPPLETARPAADAVYFMPHCPASLYGKLLELHAPNLGGLVVLGNSFSSYAERRVGDDLHPAVRGALDRLAETPIAGLDDELERPFNDLAVMRFAADGGDGGRA